MKTVRSEWITPTGFTATDVFGRDVFSVVINAPEITQAVLDEGSVTVYAKLEGYSDQLWPTGGVGTLPITLMYEVYATPLTDVWSARFAEGAIEIRFVNNANYYATVTERHQFRYVISR